MESERGGKSGDETRSQPESDSASQGVLAALPFDAFSSVRPNHQTRGVSFSE